MQVVPRLRRGLGRRRSEGTAERATTAAVLSDSLVREAPPVIGTGVPSCECPWAHRASVVLLALGAIVVDPAVAQHADTGPVRDPQHTIARDWNEVLLFGIRRDFARPTVHARNLFHLSAATYDAWAVHDDLATPYFLGRIQANGERCEVDEASLAVFRDIEDDAARESSREIAISYAMYRLIRERFVGSPGEFEIRQRTDALFDALGLDADIVSSDLAASPTPAVLGNRIAECVIDQGSADGSNEAGGYTNLRYEPLNSPLNPSLPGSQGLSDPNRWQPLELDIFIDQSGNTTGTPFFLGAEWADVLPFALTPDDVTLVQRDGAEYPVYLDPGLPALLGDDPEANGDYLNGHALVALWSAHLDPTDGVLWDISPGALGNPDGDLPEDADQLTEFYRPLDGGTTADRGHAVNPVTGEPYPAQLVPRGDYTRVLAEFWADGPDSETPPGHWFRIYNEAVSDHPAFEPRFGGGELLDPLEFDVKTYFLLGGTMHDSAIAAWSAKGAHDYIRPVSAIRYMADQGQSTDAEGSRYSVQGAPLEPGRIEVITEDDPLAGNGGANVGKIKVLAWRGSTLIADPAEDEAGVGWIPMERWVPYQRPTFVTPPFAGYVSGHSTFSRAAAEVLTLLTDDAFFPGGLAEFVAEQDEFLVFEQGPSVDVVLQWATYRDASDQTSLSRIWGGIHPPVDDIPGRRVGIEVAERSWSRANTFFDGTASASDVHPLIDVGEAPGGGGNGSGEADTDAGESDGEAIGADVAAADGGGGGGGCSIAGSGAPDPLLPALTLLLLCALARRGRTA